MKRIGLTLMAILLVACPVFSQIINIPADLPSIQAGIDAAVDGDTVLVADSTYFENINFKGKAITVASHFIVDGDTSHISKTIINGSQPINPDTASVVRMISGEDSTSVLCGFKITGGTGMFTDASLCLTYPNSTIYINGGGIIIIDGGATIRNNTITNNTITQREGRVCGGGGIDVIISESDRSNEKTLLIENNIISDNQLHGGESGGAGIRMFIDNSNTESGMNIMVQGNTFTANRITVSEESNAGVVGAGMLIGFRLPIRNGDYLIRNNNICNNRIEPIPKPAFAEGGGIYLFYLESGVNSNCAPEIYNNIITDNYSSDMAGGIGVYNWGNQSASIYPLIFNNTVINNQSLTSPGLDLVRVNPILVNNFFSNKGANSNTPEIKTITASLYQYNNAIRGTSYLGRGNINAIPIFEDDSYKLKEGSPGIGVGISSVELRGVIYETPKLDFYGNPRPDPVDMRVDMGAIESPYEPPVYIPDTAFLHALFDEGVDTNGDGQISYAEAEAIISLEVSERGIAEMTGIEAFVNLNSLSCNANPLTSLDVSNSTALTYLDVSAYCTFGGCFDGTITTLDISNNTALEVLYCGGHPLTSLDVSNKTALTILYCDNNQLTSLDVSNNNSITRIDISNMQSLNEVCVWEMPFPPSGVDIDTTGSPNVYFTTECSSTGIEERSQSELTIYPNPTYTLLTIETEYPDLYSIQITSLSGQQILIGEMEGNTHQIDLSSFQKGVYFITIRSKDFVSTRKIIKL